MCTHGGRWDEPSQGEPPSGADEAVLRGAPVIRHGYVLWANHSGEVDGEGPSYVVRKKDEVDGALVGLSPADARTSSDIFTVSCDEHFKGELDVDIADAFSVYMRSVVGKKGEALEEAIVLDQARVAAKACSTACVAPETRKGGKRRRKRGKGKKKTKKKKTKKKKTKTAKTSNEL